MIDDIPFDSLPDTAPTATPTTPQSKRWQRKPEPEPELPPHSMEAEQGVLGCCILEPSTAIDSASEQIGKFEDTAFYDLRHKMLWARLRTMWEQQIPINLLTLQSNLKDHQELDQVGGLVYLSQLSDSVPSASHLEYYVKVVCEKATLRSLIRFGHDTIAHAKQAVDANEVVSRVQSEALRINDTGSSDKLQNISEDLKEFVTVLERRKNGRQKITGLDTNLHMFNNMTCGLQPGELVVIAARPSVGKTSLGVTLAVNVLRCGHGVGFWSIEMGRQSLLHRFVGVTARVDTLKLRNGFISATDEPKLLKGYGELASYKNRLFVDDRTDLSGRDFYASVRRAKRERGISLAIVDYIQLMRGTRRGASREEEVAEVADWIKRTAKDLDISVVALAQLNRESEKDRTPREPRMSDIRESDRISQNADVIGLLWTPKLDPKSYQDMKWIQYHEPDAPKPNKANEKDCGWIDGPKLVAEEGSDKVVFPASWQRELSFVQMTVAKNRNGATGPCELVLQRRTTRFVDAYQEDYGKKESNKPKTVEGLEI